MWSPKNQEVVEKVEVCQKGVAHLVKAGKTGQKTGLYFSKEQVRSYDKDEVFVI